MTAPASQPTSTLVVKNGRFRLPSGFATPKSWLVLTGGLGNSLLLFRYDEWNPVLDKLLNFPVPDDIKLQTTILAIRRTLIGFSREVQVSARGMIGIDDDLLEHARIEGSVLWYPTSRRVELWNPIRFDPSWNNYLFKPGPAEAEL